MKQDRKEVLWLGLKTAESLQQGRPVSTAVVTAALDCMLLQAVKESIAWAVIQLPTSVCHCSYNLHSKADLSTCAEQVC